MDKINILTPEHIELEYELAGLGSRFVAIVIDLLLQGGAAAVLVLIMILLEPNIMSKGITAIYSSIILSILVVLVFLVIFGYFIFFETIWSGQTPGKRISQIQVIKDNGQPVRFIDTCIRNFLRIADFLPLYYILGILLILANKQNKRVGDMAARTIVVRLKSNLSPTTLPNLKVVSDYHFNLSKLNEEEYGLIRNFIIRRNELRPNARAHLARKISLPLMKKLEADPGEIDFEEFMEVVAVQYREQKKLI